MFLPCGLHYFWGVPLPTSLANNLLLSSWTYFLQFNFRMKSCKISTKKVSQVMYLILTQCFFFRSWTFLHNLLASGRWEFCAEFFIFDIHIAKLWNVNQPCHPQKTFIQYAMIKSCLLLNLLLFNLNAVVVFFIFFFSLLLLIAMILC